MEELVGEIQEKTGEVLPPFTYYEPVFGVEKDKQQKGDMYRRRSENFDKSYILYESKYKEATQENFNSRTPRVVTVLHLSHHADIQTVFFSLPENPYTLTDETHDGGIIAAGLSYDKIFYHDEPNVSDDDAVRTLIQEGSPHSFYDKHGQSFAERIEFLAKERPEKVAAVVSNVINPLLKTLPFASQLTILNQSSFLPSLCRQKFSQYKRCDV